jgi:hypothetical protein
MVNRPCCSQSESSGPLLSGRSQQIHVQIPYMYSGHDSGGRRLRSEQTAQRDKALLALRLYMYAFAGGQKRQQPLPIHVRCKGDANELY